MRIQNYSIEVSSFLLDIFEHSSRDFRVWTIHLKIVYVIYFEDKDKKSLCLYTGPILWRADSVTTGTSLSTSKV